MKERFKKYVIQMLDKNGYISYNDILISIKKYGLDISEIYYILKKELKLQVGYILICPKCLSDIGIISGDKLDKIYECPNCGVEIYENKEIQDKVYYDPEKFKNLEVLSVQILKG